MTFLSRFFRRFTGRTQSPAKRAESDAQKSARKYWEREVADEKVRRGTADRPQKD